MVVVQLFLHSFLLGYGVALNHQNIYRFLFEIVENKNNYLNVCQFINERKNQLGESHMQGNH